MRTFFEYLRPKSLNEAISMKEEHGPLAYFWAGGTDITLHWKQEKFHPKYCIDINYLNGLKGINILDDKIIIGAKTSLWEIERSGERHILLRTLSDITKLMCTPQTRSLATIAGNICTASPAADLTPALMAMGANITAEGSNGQRTIPLKNFFKGVNKTLLNDGEIVVEISIPINKSVTKAASYKRVDRTVVDIALVNSSSCISINTQGIILDSKIALGAVAPVVILVEDAKDVIIGKSLDELDSKLINKVCEISSSIAKPITDVRASKEYRSDMIGVMTKRSLLNTIAQLKESLK